MAHVLVVDAEPALRHQLLVALNDSGHTAIEAATGHEAMQFAAGRLLNVVLLGIDLPDFDALALLTSLLRLQPSMSAVAMTAFPSVQTSVACFKAGLKDYIHKPIEAKRVVQLVDALTARNAKSSDEFRLLSSSCERTDTSRTGQRTWRPSAAEASFVTSLAEQWGTSRNGALRRLVRAAMKQATNRKV